MGFEKLVNELDMKEASRAGLVTRPLTQKVVEKHLEDLGIEPEFGTHSHMRGLSGAPSRFPVCMEALRALEALRAWEALRLLGLFKQNRWLRSMYTSPICCAVNLA